MLGEQTQKISLNYYCRPTFAISKLKITLRRVLACYSVLSLFYSALLWINSILLLLYESLFTVTFKHSLLPFLHDFTSINSSWQTLQRLLMQSFVSVTKEKFGRVSPLNVKALGKSDVRPCVSPAARSLNGLSMSRFNRPSRTNHARHIKPGALIIQKGDGCRRQINVFYNSTLAFHCNLSWREGKTGL